MSQFGVETPKNFLLAPLTALFCTPFSKLWHFRYINFVTDLKLAPAPTIPRPPHFSNQIYATAIVQPLSLSLIIFSQVHVYEFRCEIVCKLCTFVSHGHDQSPCTLHLLLQLVMVITDNPVYDSLHRWPLTCDVISFQFVLRATRLLYPHNQSISIGLQRL